MPDEHDRLSLVEMVEAVERTAGYIAGFELESFIGDRRTCDAVTMQVFVLGEAAGRLSEAGKALLGNLDWRQIQGLRNRIAHGYGTVDFSIIWAIAVLDAPELGKRARAAHAGWPASP